MMTTLAVTHGRHGLGGAQTEMTRRCFCSLHMGAGRTVLMLGMDCVPLVLIMAAELAPLKWFTANAGSRGH